MVYGFHRNYMTLKLYAYVYPNTMKGHKLTDDVAICWAKSKKEAIEIFSKMYSIGSGGGDVKEVHFNSDGIAVLTDY